MVDAISFYSDWQRNCFVKKLLGLFFAEKKTLADYSPFNPYSSASYLFF